MSALAALILSFVLWPFLSLWRAYCIVMLWDWFVLPATGIKPPSMYLIIGGMMTLALILPIPRTPKQEGDVLSNYFSSVIEYALLYPALALGVGWIWKWLQWGLA